MGGVMVRILRGGTYRSEEMPWVEEEEGDYEPQYICGKEGYDEGEE